MDNPEWASVGHISVLSLVIGEPFFDAQSHDVDNHNWRAFHLTNDYITHRSGHSGGAPLHNLEL